MNGAPVTLKRGKSQATLLSHANKAFEIEWRNAGGKLGFALLNRGTPLQVALNPGEPAEFFYRELGAQTDWQAVSPEDSAS